MHILGLHILGLVYIYGSYMSCCIHFFSAIFAANLIHGFGIRKELTTYCPVFPVRVLGLSYAPLKFSKEKSLLWLLLLNRLMEFLEFKQVNTY